MPSRLESSMASQAVFFVQKRLVVEIPRFEKKIVFQLLSASFTRRVFDDFRLGV